MISIMDVDFNYCFILAQGWVTGHQVPLVERSNTCNLPQCKIQ